MRLLWLAAAFLAGAWLAVAHNGAWTPPPLAILLWALAAAAWGARAGMTGRRVFPAVVALLFLAGLARGAGAGSAGPVGDLRDLASAGPVSLDVRLTAEPRPYGDATRLPAHADWLLDGERRIAIEPPARVDVIAESLHGAAGPLRGFRYGDRYRVTGHLEHITTDGERPPGVSREAVAVIRGGTVTLLSANEGSSARRWLSGVRGGVSASLREVLPEPAAGLAGALTAGDRSGIGRGLRTDFRRAGLSHLLAISGLHVAIVTALAAGVSAWALGRRRQLYLLVPLGAVWCYAALAGMPPSVTRAAVMASVYLAARALGRQRSVFPALGLAGALMVLADPRAVVSLSFQLSFAAVAGIAVLDPPIMAGGGSLWRRLPALPSRVERALHVPARGLAISTAAVAATVPLIGGTFGEVPVWGPVATLVALPAVPFVIVLSGIAAALAAVSEPLAYPAAWGSWLAAEWMLLTARLFAAAPVGPVSTTGWNGGFTIAWYAGLAAVVGNRAIVGAGRRAMLAALRAFRTGAARVPHAVPSWALGGALVFAALPWIAVWQLPDSRLTVTFHETDRGSLTFIETPGGRQVLVDGGRDPDGAVRALGAALPFWDRSIDLVILTHPDADHVGGLPAVLDRYRVATVIDAAADGESATWAGWRARLDARSGPTLRATPGLLVALDGHTTLEVLSAGPFPGASEPNDASTVARLRYGDVSMLLTADIERAAEARLLSSGAELRSAVLTAPHHGSDTSSSERLLRAVSPSLVVVPVGSENRFGHPSPSVMARYRSVLPDAQVYVTKDSGNVRAQTDGRRLWVTAGREAPR